MNTEDQFYRELLTTIEQKFDYIEERLELLWNRVNSGCYLCGNRTPACKLSDCPHENNHSNLN